MAGGSAFDLDYAYSGYGSTKGKMNKRIIILLIVVGVVVVLALAIGLGVHYGTKDDKEERDLSTATEAEKSRIDCYPEALYGSEVTKEKCEERGCTYEVSPIDEVPACFVSSGSSLGRGYSVANEINTESGIWLELDPRASSRRARSLDNLVALTFRVQYHGPNVVRIKVGALGKYMNLFAH